MTEPKPIVIKRWIWEAGAIAIGALTLFIVLRRLDEANGLLLSSGQPLFGDFLAFWTGGRHALLGQLTSLYNEPANHLLQAQAIPNIDLIVPFYSPPIFLLMMAPIAALNYLPAAILFLIISFSVYAAAAWRLAPDKRALLFAATLPVAILHLATLQADILFVGLTGLAVSFLDRKPITAGAFVALLAIKPHLAILWPLMLAVQGRWRAFGAACGALAALIAITLAIFGPQVFVDFLTNLPTAQSAIDRGRVGAHAVASLYGTLLLGGAPKAIAIAAHGASALAAIGACILIWRRGNTVVSAAALCAATTLISPYMFFYDMPLLGLAALLLAGAGASATLSGQFTLAIAWAAGLITILLNAFVPAPICPLASWLLIACAYKLAQPAPARVAEVLAPSV
ncbi:MAG: glycosyltransferase family 87 protein [Alphaproteobacteria bacterium]